MTSRCLGLAQSKMKSDEKQRGKRKNAREEDPGDKPIIVNGWKIYFWQGFRDQLTEFEKILAKLGRKNPSDWQRNKQAKFILRVFRIILEEVPGNPTNPVYRQGKTLGDQYKHWHRAKFAERFRLFFRYDLENKILVFVWLNDDDTQRKSGAGTDVYNVFRSMLNKGQPPNSWNDLAKESNILKAKDKPE